MKERFDFRTYWRRHWYEIGGIIFVALSFIMGLWGCYHLPRIQVILVFSWMAMLAHQVEEYGFPGGFPSIANIAAFGEKKEKDRYPFNQLQCFICNVFLCYGFYILAILFPDCIWLGASQVCSGALQILVHGILANIALKGHYNPGLGASVFIQTPVAAYYITYVLQSFPGQAWQLWLGIPGLVIAMVIVFIGPVILFRNRDNRYPFDPEEMYGYDKEKILRIYHSDEMPVMKRLGIK